MHADEVQLVSSCRIKPGGLSLRWRRAFWLCRIHLDYAVAGVHALTHASANLLGDPLGFFDGHSAPHYDAHTGVNGVRPDVLHP